MTTSEQVRLDLDLIRDTLTYLDRPSVFWPHHRTCMVKRKDIVMRLRRVIAKEGRE